jgi:selenocysteine lyase/cysteine desulfurase
VVGAAAAGRYALELGIDAIEERARALADRLREGLGAVDGVRLLDRGPDVCAIVTMTVAGRRSEDLHGELERRRINSSVADRETALYDFTEKRVEAALRLSPHYYNTEDEVDEVVAAIGELTRGA